MKKIRDRNGAVFEMPDDYILRDGEAMSVDVQFMDSINRSTIHDGNGRPPVNGRASSSPATPGPTRRAEAYHEYRNAITERWRGEPATSPVTSPAVTDRATAYAASEDTIKNRWRAR
jgi:hypothetical protein